MIARSSPGSTSGTSALGRTGARRSGDAGNGGRRGLFLGHDCSTSIAPAVFALRYHCPLHTAICYRVGLGRWRIEVGDEIPTREDGNPRTVDAITEDINQTFEVAVRRDPANWFWVHNRWKAEKSKVAKSEPEVSGETEMLLK